MECSPKPGNSYKVLISVHCCCFTSCSRNHPYTYILLLKTYIEFITIATIVAKPVKQTHRQAYNQPQTFAIHFLSMAMRIMKAGSCKTCHCSAYSEDLHWQIIYQCFSLIFHVKQWHLTMEFNC